jgi:glucokinase
MYLAADLGATKTLVALAEPDAGRIAVRFERRYEDDDFASFDALLERFLREMRGALGDVVVRGACIGAAGPVAAGRVALTNRDWTLDEAALATRFGWPRVRIVNDFAAAASGIEALGADDLATLQDGAPQDDGPRVVLGAGTGLGVAYMISVASGWRVVAGEGGHGGFAAENDEQAALAAYWRVRLGRVSDETLLSGVGIERCYAFVRDASPGAPSALDAALARGDGPAAITAAADAGDLLAGQALDLFAQCYGQVAGDHALAVMATGGVYVAGGLAPKLLDRLQSGGFMRAFRAKGAHAAVMARIPVHVVMHPALGLIGAAVIAAREAIPRGT